MSEGTRPSSEDVARWDEPDEHRLGYRSSLLSLPGAVSAQGIDTGVALHYGDPMGEQRAALTAAGFVDRSNRTLLGVTGRDRLAWLDALMSQRVADLPEGRAAEALILTLDGHVEFYCVVTNVGDMIVLGAEPGGRGDLMLDFLLSHRSVFDVDVRVLSPEWETISVVGPRCVDVLADVGIATPPDVYSVQSLSGGGTARRMPFPHRDTVDLMVPLPLLSQIAHRLSGGARFVGIAAYEALRVMARRPRIRFEVGPGTLPHEVGWMGVAVTLDKGPFRGREAVERVERPPRRMVLLRLDPSLDELPRRHAPVTSDGRQVGFVGTAVRHVDEGPMASALLGADVPDDAPLTVGGAPATVEPAR
jgi:tRNA-modifying protein YgfZ